MSPVHQDLCTRRFFTDNGCRIIIGVCILFLAVICGVIGHSIGSKQTTCDTKGTPTPAPDKGGLVADSRIAEIVKDIGADNIKKNLRDLTYQKPHAAGLGNCNASAGVIRDAWTQQGFDDVTVHTYNILLSYPRTPGRLDLHQVNATGARETVGSITVDNEPVVDPSEEAPNEKVIFPFNAFSPAGTVTGEIVFANYGNVEDFDWLLSQGVNLTGKIALTKYSHGSRHNKVKRATDYGCVGCLIYTDLSDYSKQGEEYPAGWMLNENGIQRGTINKLPGDALSVGYPAKDGYWRLSESKQKGLPTIPSQPISFKQARQIFQHMKGNVSAVPVEWTRNEKNPRNDSMPYKLESGAGVTFTLTVDTVRVTKPTHSVCATMYGRLEKDRYVLVGNHRDSWTFGASDASSGTAALMEIARSFGENKKKNGWRPRRSMMFCSWDAEEPGTLGSTEWADDHHQFIRNHVVAYLNVDMAVEGSFTIRLKSLTHIEDSIFNAAKKVPAPDSPESTTLYTDWLEKSKLLYPKETTLSKPKIFTPSSGSDYKCFWWTYGTTIVDYRYLFSKVDYPWLSTNGHYHTRYESFGWMEKHIDPKFIYHKALAQLWAQHSISVAEDEIIPYDLVKYVQQVQGFQLKLNTSYGEMLAKQQINLNFLAQRLDVLLTEATKFSKNVKDNFANMTTLEKRCVNDKIMNFERNFIYKGLTANAATRHVVFAGSGSRFVYSGNKFPGIQEAIYDAHNNVTNGDWDGVRKHITLVVWCVDTATMSLQV